MIIDMPYWTKVLKRILYFAFTILGLYLSFKLSIFYMPFLVAFIISLMIEPIIKKMMKKFKMKRRTSSIIIFLIVSGVILGGLIWGIMTLFSEASNLLQGLNDYFDKAYNLFQNFMNEFDFNKIKVSDEILGVIQNSTGGVLTALSNWVRNILNGLINIVTSIPIISIYFVITVMALYFICVDKIYILDQIEHHIPELWVKKVGKHMKDLIKTLGGYLKAQATLVLASFLVSLVGLYILHFVGFNIQYPLLMAIFIGFVDALPILGSGTVMVPWAIIAGLNGDLNLGIAIIVLLIIMSVARQFLEPRLVSKNIGVHPIFTLIAMYTGFKFWGILGMLFGPIILIILKNVFATMIDGGVVKTLFDKK
ncbi:MAG: sporulation integral membrane protein YtvI [Clostridia bacterium]|nr:sporulation integral membrane protein YtvI [Clostridia bacterium]